MTFYVIPRNVQAYPYPSSVLLFHDDWNDWWEFETSYSVVIIDGTGQRFNVGRVKIGQFNMSAKIPDIPQTFDALDERFFSLGQDANYYETLLGYGEEVREYILRSLRDIAFDTKTFEAAKGEKVTTSSLLRSVTAENVQSRLHRLANGNPDLTQYQFTYIYPTENENVRLTFDVVPHALPPTNVHVIIGRNGVGKTTLLQNIARCLVLPQLDAKSGRVITNSGPGVSSFTNLVSVSFSAFDSFALLEETRDARHVRPYTYIGLRKKLSDTPSVSAASEESRRPISDLANDFVESVLRCRLGARKKRWQAALSTLESDPLFSEADVISLSEVEAEVELREQARTLFGRLSSGHKIVLLTTTRLVESVDEGTLVLLDEPEAHLHPPLLSAFVRALSELLISRNGVAIIASHSPVVLQEVSRDSVWIINRHGAFPTAYRPEIETFGENAGILTREVFQLEVTSSGFHQLIEEIVKEVRGNYDELVARFGGKLGAEARAAARVLCSRHKTSQA
jgi:ABC-type transport system involved in cytochrome c biogenesis ATPase subunit